MPTSGQIMKLNSTSSGGDTLQIADGYARDTTDTTWITVPTGQTRTVNVTASGPGGLDTGAAQPKTSYALWIIDANGTVNGLLSASFTAPTVAAGTTFRRIGSTFTNAQSKLVGFIQTGATNDRNQQYMQDIAALALLVQQQAAAFTQFNLGPPIPKTVNVAQLFVNPTPGSTTTIRAQAGAPELPFTGPTIFGITPPLNTDKGEFKTSNGPTSVAALGFTESL